jgi:hypothetical protein
MVRVAALVPWLHESLGRYGWLPGEAPPPQSMECKVPRVHLLPGVSCSRATPEVLAIPKFEQGFQFSWTVNQAYAGGLCCPSAGSSSSTTAMPLRRLLLVAIASAFSKASLRLRLDLAAYQAAPRLGVPRSRGISISGGYATRLCNPLELMVTVAL